MDWFGPACQYATLKYNVTVASVRQRHSDSLQSLADHDDTTCAGGSDWPFLFELEIPSRLTWVRIVVSDADRVTAISLSYINHVGDTRTLRVLEKSKMIKVDERTLDLLVRTNEPVNQFHLKASGFNTQLCGLYISGGRNVALHQYTHQSSTSWNSSNAVNGVLGGVDEDSASLEQACSRTANSTTGFWTVTFSEPKMISRFLIYGWREPEKTLCCEDGLMGFRLIALDKSSNNVFNYNDKSKTPQDMYSIIPTSTIQSPVMKVIIVQGENSEFLTLCEVLAFGDSACSPGRYGRECEHTCNCAEGSCFVPTGGCPSGCAPGYTGEDCWTPCLFGTYGPGCAKTCSVNCNRFGDACSPVNGSCVYGCELGYQPPLCDEECPSGTYGSACAKACSVHCAGPNNTCNRIDGACDEGCEAGYQLPLCDEKCPSGTYGSACAKTCSVHCAGPNNTCNRIDGACDEGCEAGYQLPLCDEICQNGTYGYGCRETCSDNCAGPNNSCNVIDGSCDSGCEAGYQPPLCVEVCQNGTYGYGCRETCSDNCAGPNNSCNVADGSCDSGCEAGYQPPLCIEVCQNGMHGYGCRETCSDNCAGPNNSCNVVDGSCDSGCEAGYQPPLCAEVSDGLDDKARPVVASSMFIGLLAAAAVALVAAVVVAVVVWRRRRASTSDNDDQEAMLPME